MKPMTRLLRFAGIAAVLTLAVLLAVPLLRERQPDSATAADERPLATVTDLLGRQVQVRLPVKRVILGEGRQRSTKVVRRTRDSTLCSE